MRLSVWNHNAGLGLCGQKNRELGSFLFGPIKRPLPLEEGSLDNHQHAGNIRLRRITIVRVYSLWSIHVSTTASDRAPHGAGLAMSRVCAPKLGAAIALQSTHPGRRSISPMNIVCHACGATNEVPDELLHDPCGHHIGEAA